MGSSARKLIAIAALLAMFASSFPAPVSLAEAAEPLGTVELIGRYAYRKATKTSPEASVLALDSPIGVSGAGGAATRIVLSAVQLVPPNPKPHGKEVRVKGRLFASPTGSAAYVAPYYVADASCAAIPAVSKVTLSKASLRLSLGEAARLVAGVAPSSANSPLWWNARRLPSRTLSFQLRASAIIFGALRITHSEIDTTRKPRIVMNHQAL